NPPCWYQVISANEGKTREKPYYVFNVAITTKATKHRLTELPRHAVPSVLAGTAVLENIPGNLGQASFTLLDPYLAMLCRWARELRQAPGKLGHLGPYLENIVARASVARTIEREGIEPPFL
ncbi:MAG: hypothetical protein QF398_03000, partial [Alphaproteobacteria bacterium]|nr:hypothetical protein [Alphaproteobacteria bacterium]